MDFKCINALFSVIKGVVPIYDQDIDVITLLATYILSWPW